MRDLVREDLERVIRSVSMPEEGGGGRLGFEEFSRVVNRHEELSPHPSSPVRSSQVPELARVFELLNLTYPAGGEGGTAARVRVLTPRLHARFLICQVTTARQRVTEPPSSEQT